jgi:hypothetical protein
MKKYTPIPNWENYGISKNAEIVRLVARKGAQQGLVLKQHVHKTRGYLTVRLYDRDRQRTFDVHRLMAITFLGLNDSMLQVCHNNGVKTDCKLNNLRLGTRVENEFDKVAHGSSNRGEKFGKSKYTEQQVFHAKTLLASGMKAKDVAKETHIALGSVQAISCGANWAWLEIKK